MPEQHHLENIQNHNEEEQHYKTLAVRVEEDLHTQLRFIAQLSGSSIAEEIRIAIQQRIATAQDDPQLIERAQQAREKIEREAAARAAAIAGFIGRPATHATLQARTGSTGSGRRSNNAKNVGE